MGQVVNSVKSVLSKEGRILRQGKKALRKSNKPDEDVLEIGLIMDCTGSMVKYMEQAKEMLREIVDDAK